LRAAREASYTLTGTRFMAWRAGWNDGRLSYATERILETFYSFSPAKKTWLSLGFQRIGNPGYNRDRGPADFLSPRIHAEI
jgi:hypothetical protein